jgi:hypothetical protein
VSLISAYVGLSLIGTNPIWRENFTSLFRLLDVPGTEVLLLAAAFVIGVLVEMVLLLFWSVREFGLEIRVLLKNVVEAALAAIVAGLVAYLTLIFVVDGVNQETFIGIMLQGLVAGFMGVAAALLTYYLLSSRELTEIYRSYHLKIFKTDVIAPQQDTL